MRPTIVAEIGASHAQSFDTALQLVKQAALAGADAVKFQTWDRMTVSRQMITGGEWAGNRMDILYATAKLSWDWHKDLFQASRALGILPFSSPFDKKSVDFLESLDCFQYKIASFEITDLDLIRYVAQTKKPIVISTGMATLEEIRAAVVAARGCADITLLKCLSAYPAGAKGYNLAAMKDIAHRFGCHVGVSDHTKSSAVACAAIAMGATMVEKHITCGGKGLDALFATHEQHFGAFVKDCHDTYDAVGQVVYGPQPAEQDQLQFRRSIWATRDVEEGESFTEDNVAVLRPIGGLPPMFMPWVLNGTAECRIAAGTALKYEHVKSA